MIKRYDMVVQTQTNCLYRDEQHFKTSYFLSDLHKLKKKEFLNSTVYNKFLRLNVIAQVYSNFWLRLRIIGRIDPF